MIVLYKARVNERRRLQEDLVDSMAMALSLTRKSLAKPSRQMKSPTWQIENNHMIIFSKASNYHQSPTTRPTINLSYRLITRANPHTKEGQMTVHTQYIKILYD